MVMGLIGLLMAANFSSNALIVMIGRAWRPWARWRRWRSSGPAGGLPRRALPQRAAWR
jgi:hypothetical protein